MAADDCTTDQLDSNRPLRDRPLRGTLRLVDAESLRQRLDWSHAPTRRLDWVEETLMAAALAQAWEDDRRFIAYSRAATWWSSPGRHYLDHRLSFCTVVPSVDRLHRLGLFEHDRKCPSARSLGYESRYRASAEIRAMAASEPPPPLRHERMRDTIILRDKNRRSIGFHKSRFTAKVRRTIATLQEARDGIVVDLDDGVPCLCRYPNYLRVADKNDEPHGFHLTDCPYFTVYSNACWGQGGRRYGLWVQSAPKDVRRHITINGEPTAEEDYGQTHFRMVCADAGLAVEADDLFDLRGFDRRDVKRMAYIMLNADDPVAAKRAFAKRKSKGTYALAGKIADALLAKFPQLMPYLHTGIGVRLQRRDADIADDVMLTLLRAGIIALPIFNSFRVQARHVGRLKEAMDEAWERHVGTPITVTST